MKKWIVGAAITAGIFAAIVVIPYFFIHRNAWLIWAGAGAPILFLSFVLFFQHPSGEGGDNKPSKTAIFNAIFAMVAIEAAIAVISFTGADMYYMRDQTIHFPDIPVLVAMVFLIPGLLYELRVPKTEWKIRKEMIPLALASLFFAVWASFTFALLFGRYPGGAQDPFDVHFHAVYPMYSVFTGTVFFGCFPAIYFMVKPSSSVVVGATVYNLLCLIVVPIGTFVFHIWKYPYIEDYIMEALGLVMFFLWYWRASSDERKLFGRFTSLLVILVTCAIAVGVLLVLVLTGVIHPSFY